MENLFEIEYPRKKILAFVTQGGHVSGEIMKNIEFRMPKVIEQFKKRASDGLEIGDVLILQDCVFVVYKKHYNSKILKEKFEIILNKVAPELNEFSLKTTDEHLPEFKDLILNYLPDIEFRKTSKWDY